ncbi:MAG TPA: hypothetical protein VJ124_16140 [Pyrinomonadaceae bacterium]|nr:hypothetical protein [Pyrinomonadaceae bacterium]
MKDQPTRKIFKRRLTLLVVICGVGAIVLVSLGGVAALTRQTHLETPKEANAVIAQRDYVTVSVAGQNVQVDSQTGQIKPLTTDEAQKLAQGLKELVNQSSEGLVEVRHADGSTSVDLQNRFQSLAVAKRDTRGNVTQSCVDNPRSAAAFFEIDPHLIEGAAKSPARTSNGVQTSNRTEQKSEVQ